MSKSYLLCYYTSIMKEEQVKNFILLKRVIIALIAISLFFIGVGSGVYLSLKYQQIIPIRHRISSEEEIYIGEVNGLYGNENSEFQARDIDFSLFWDTWKTLKEN